MLVVVDVVITCVSAFKFREYTFDVHTAAPQQSGFQRSRNRFFCDLRPL